MSIRDLAKHLILSTSHRLGINRLFSQRARDRLLVLCYHAVIPDDAPLDGYRCRVAVRARQFREQLGLLCREFTPVRPRDVLDWVAGGANLPSRPVLVTFDDGYRNNATWAVPELERSGVPAAFLVSTAYIGQQRILWTQELDELVLNWPRGQMPLPNGSSLGSVPGSLEGRVSLARGLAIQCKQLNPTAREAYLDRLREGALTSISDCLRDLYEFLTWDDVRAIAARGFAVGSHTVTHPILTTLDSRELHCELCESKRKIEEELGVECPWIAYPNGGLADVSPAVLQAARQAGYRVGFTLFEHGNPGAPDPLAIDRVCITGELQQYAFDARVCGIAQLMAGLRT